MSYQIARDKKEAKQQHADGFGYDTREAAEAALADPKMDSYYRGLLKIFKIEE